MSERSEHLVAEIVEIISRVVGPYSGQVPLHEPKFLDSDRHLILECLSTGWVSSAGPFVEQFETEVAAYCGVEHAVAVSCGTAALHVALHLLGVRGGDEILVPALTFVATANAVSYCGAVPHFVDSNSDNFGIDPGLLRAHLRSIGTKTADGLVNKQTGRKIPAIIPVHTLGIPADMDGISEVAQEFGLAVIEDASEALGSEYKGRRAGSLAMVGALSFNGNKIITTGGGGMLLFHDDALAQRAKHLTTTAKLHHRWKYVHDEVGWNYRMPNLNAALGLGQLRRLPQILADKRALAQLYQEFFSLSTVIDVVTECDNVKTNYWLNAILLKEKHENLRDSILEETHRLGLMTRPLWTPLHVLPMYSLCPRANLSNALSLERRMIKLPSSAHLIQNLLD